MNGYKLKGGLRNTRPIRNIISLGRRRSIERERSRSRQKNLFSFLNN